MPTVAHRFTAVLGIALVLALNLLAVWPEGHAWLHAAKVSCDEPAHAHGHSHDHAPGEDQDDAEDDDCVIVQFAAGTVGSTPAPLFVTAPLFQPLTSLALASAIGAHPPAHLLPPGCGPPAA